MAIHNVTSNHMVPICFFGIFFSYLIFGIFQEKINRSPYGPERKRFHYTSTLVLSQCIFNVIWAYLALRLKANHDVVDKTPKRYLASCAFTYVLAMISSNTALKWVNYPTQVVGKSIKPIPVLIMGVLFGKMKYPLSKYLNVLLITSGVVMFMYHQKKPSLSVSNTHGIFGEALLVFSLACDGLTAAIQSRMKQNWKTGAFQLMFNVNIFACIFLLPIIIYRGEIVEAVEFLKKYPDALSDIFFFGFTSALGQNFIFLSVSHLGPLVCSIMTTTRKFFTVLCSVLFFSHQLSSIQWIGVLMVFVGLGMDAFMENKSHSRSSKSE